MINEFYRFRSISSLIGNFEELENQSIYFAEPQFLNDPMEGYRDVYWEGDFIVWRNLFNHYLLCLEKACSLVIISGEEHQFVKMIYPFFLEQTTFQLLHIKNYSILFLRISLKMII